MDEGMRVTRARRRGLVLLWGSAATLWLCSLVLPWVPMNVDGGAWDEEASFSCGSLLRPDAGQPAFLCEGEQSRQVLWVVGMLLIAFALSSAALIRGAHDRERITRAVGWAAWPVFYLVAVLAAALVTYPYVAMREYATGLEYFFQLTVAIPLWFAVPSGGSAHATVGWLLLAGLIQVALVAAVCVVGYRRSNRRSEHRGPAPVT